MGCGYSVCDNGVDGGFSRAGAGVLVCNYWPPGNWNSPAQFRANVQKPQPMPSNCANGGR
jgi:hypothetical protein